MAKKTTIYKGTVAEIALTLKSDGTDFKIGDTTSVSQVSVDFYISGTYGKEGAAKISIDRDEDTDKCFIDDDDKYTLTFHVPTTSFNAGTLCATVTGKYKDLEHGEDIELDFVYSTELNAEIKNVGV